MTPSAFSELVKNPALLRNYSLTELQELALRHPYASPVYSMIALKAHLDGDSNYEHYLNQAAIRIADRKRLYQLIHTDYDYWVTEALPPLVEREVLVEDPEAAIHEPEKAVEEEDIEKTEPIVSETPPQEEVTEEVHIEERVTPLHVVREEQPEKTPEPEPQPELEAEPEKPAPVEEPTEKLNLPEEKNIDLPGANEVLEALSGLRHSRDERQRETGIQEDDDAPVLQKEKRVITGSGAHSFTEWLSLLSKGKPEELAKPGQVTEDKQAQQAVSEIPLLPESPELESLPAETEEEKEIEEIITSKQAKSSLVEDDELVTETLAQVYELQRKFDKAIKAYQRLSLKYPDKKAYFAGKIETLKNR